VRGDCLLCWYWWNCWSSLFTLYKKIQNKVVFPIWMKMLKPGIHSGALKMLVFPALQVAPVLLLFNNTYIMWYEVQGITILIVYEKPIVLVDNGCGSKHIFLIKKSAGGWFMLISDFHPDWKNYFILNFFVKCKQWWSTIPSISTEQTITSHTEMWTNIYISYCSIFCD
jgi:hypothetical protein